MHAPTREYYHRMNPLDHMYTTLIPAIENKIESTDKTSCRCRQYLHSIPSTPALCFPNPYVRQEKRNLDDDLSERSKGFMRLKLADMEPLRRIIT